MSQLLQDSLDHCKKLTYLANDLEKKIILEKLEKEILLEIINLTQNIDRPPAGLPSHTRNNASTQNWSSSLRR